jgi:hypothetical protein
LYPPIFIAVIGRRDRQNIYLHSCRGEFPFKDPARPPGRENISWKSPAFLCRASWLFPEFRVAVCAVQQDRKLNDGIRGYAAINEDAIRSTRLLPLIVI